MAQGTRTLALEASRRLEHGELTAEVINENTTNPEFTCVLQVIKVSLRYDDANTWSRDRDHERKGVGEVTTASVRAHGSPNKALFEAREPLSTAAQWI